MEDEILKGKIINIFNLAIQSTDDLLEKIYRHVDFTSNDIKEILELLVNCLNIYTKVNPNYDFTIILLGVNNIQKFLENKDFIFLIDVLEFEIKSSLIDMKNVL